MALAKKVAKKSGNAKFTLDGGVVASDGLVSMQSLEVWLSQRIKVDGVTGNFEKTDRATGVVTRRVNLLQANNVITVEAMLPFKKRYIKYLIKRYLCLYDLRDFIRVVSVGKDAYGLKYFAAVKEGVKA